MPSKYQPLVQHIAEQTEEAVTLTFAEMEAIIGFPLTETMQIDTWVWKSSAYAFVWQLRAFGWQARLDRRNRCVIFTHDDDEEAE